MTIRYAACNCGQLHITIEGEPSRISMCHCLECQRRTGAVISNQARFRREQVTFAGKATAWMRTAESGNALTFHFCPTCGSTSTGRVKAFLDMSPSPSAASPTRTSPRRPLVCGRSHATLGSPYHPTRRPSASRSRGEITADGPLPGVDLGLVSRTTPKISNLAGDCLSASASEGTLRHGADFVAKVFLHS
jgi:hypothetical protein